jgi:nitroreductase
VQDDLIVSGLHPLLAARWSPTTFDPEFELDAVRAASLVEAARWAPSAGNSQPWAFIMGCRGDETHQRLVRHLAASSSRWAPSASVLVANLAHRFVAGTDWEYSEFSHYDLGQAVAHMTIQAQALGLFARQFRAFDRDAVAAEFGVPDHWEVTTMSAFGRVRATTDSGAEQAPESVRERRAVSELLWTSARPPAS